MIRAGGYQQRQIRNVQIIMRKYVATIIRHRRKELFKVVALSADRLSPRINFVCGMATSPEVYGVELAAES